MARILIVDDEKNVRATVGRALSLEGHDTVEAADGQEALLRLDEGGIHLALVDLSMPRLDGLEFIDALRRRGEVLPVIVLTAHGTVEKAVRALRLGAHDFIEKPPDRERLLHAIGQALAHSKLSREVEDLRRESGAGDEIIGTGLLMQALRDNIRLAAPSDARILITGENGTGKELVARAVHRESSRQQQPFIKVNCAAVPDALFESELFGHVRGAFTDARENRRGRFELAEGGSLFLDEVAEIPPQLQAKLLRAIETGEVERLGGKGEFKVDVRIIAATNRDLEEQVKTGAFRQDLFYRLNVVRLHVPPLRQRLQDLPALAVLFLQGCCRRNGYAPKKLEDEAMGLLARHAYPGNVRELRNAVERLTILTPATAITAADVGRVLPEIGGGVPPPGGSLKDQVAACERTAVLRALAEEDGRMADAARALGMERSHLYKKMKALGIERA